MEVTLSRYETKNRTITEWEQTGQRNPDGTPKLRRVEIPRKVWSWKHEATLHRFDGYQWKEIAKDRFPVDLVEEGAGVNKHSDSSLGTRAGTEATPAGEWLLSKLIWVNPLSGRVQGEQRLVDIHIRNDSLFPLIATTFKVDWNKLKEPAEQWTDAVLLLPGKQFQHQLLRTLTNENIGRGDRFRRPKVQVSGVRLATSKK